MRKDWTIIARLHLWIDTKFQGWGLNISKHYWAIYVGPINLVIDLES